MYGGNSLQKIEIRENKKLILKKVINKSLDLIPLENLDTEINRFYNNIQALKAQVFGPLIIRNKGMKISDDGQITSDYDLYIQAHDYKQYKNQFNVLDEVVVEYCLYTRFEGKPEYIQLAFNKLEIYEYEEDIITRGDVYMVSLEDSQDYIIMDIFKPVKMI